jgi:N4-gp56 family major capsid protein
MADSVNVLTPGAIPAEFNDWLAQELLLAPDAQFVLARSAFSAALAAQFEGDGAFDLAMMQFKEGRMGPQGFLANMPEAMSQGMGGPLTPLGQMTYPGFVKVVTDPAKAMPGEVIKINRPKFLANPTTEASRLLAPQDQVFGGASQVPGMDQVPVTIKEYFGPTDAAGNKAPLNLAEFTRNRSMHDLLAYVGMLLRRDRYALVDFLMHLRLLDAAVAAGNVTFASNMTALSQYTAPGNESCSFDMLVRANEAMRSTPRFAPGVENKNRYVTFLDTHQISDLKLDPQYQKLSQYHKELDPLFPGYIATVENLIICEDNNMPRLTGQGVNSNLTVYQGIMVAPGVLGWANTKGATPLRDRNDDGGRFDRYAWNVFEGWQVLDDRFVQAIQTG